ncbi:unnamed protein product [Rotaria sp. Silwood2]|nr:unnamed protein product [Rotaria sp. Silwood2]
MSDLNSFSTKSTLKKFFIDQQYSNDIWQDLSDVTPTFIYDDQNLDISSLSNEKNTNSWQTINDYKAIPKSYGFDSEQAGYCRFDRHGHWLLVSPSHPFHDDGNKAITYDDTKHLSKDSSSQQIEHTFPDSCESLTVSIDFHVPTDELITDNDDTNGQHMAVCNNQIQHYDNITSDEICTIPR